MPQNNRMAPQIDAAPCGTHTALIFVYPNMCEITINSVSVGGCNQSGNYTLSVNVSWSNLSGVALTIAVDGQTYPQFVSPSGSQVFTLTLPCVSGLVDLEVFDPFDRANCSASTQFQGPGEFACVLTLDNFGCGPCDSSTGTFPLQINFSWNSLPNSTIQFTFFDVLLSNNASTFNYTAADPSAGSESLTLDMLCTSSGANPRWESQGLGSPGSTCAYSQAFDAPCYLEVLSSTSTPCADGLTSVNTQIRWHNVNWNFIQVDLGTLGTQFIALTGTAPHSGITNVFFTDLQCTGGNVDITATGVNQMNIQGAAPIYSIKFDETEEEIQAERVRQEVVRKKRFPNLK